MNIEDVEIGDLVQHRASGERGVVVRFNFKCEIHPACCHNSLVEGCVFVKNDRVGLSVGFGKECDDVDISLLEFTDDEQPICSAVATL